MRQHIIKIDGMKKCCQVCLFETNKRNSLDVVIICDTHRIRLCNGKPQPHVRQSGMRKADEKMLVTDFCLAAPDPDKNYWDNYHQLYLPHFVKLKEHQQFFDKNNFHVNKKKNAALGKTVEKRGRKRKHE
jgi:hypothetical protein